MSVVIAKALAGWRPAGLLAYLMGPGSFEEHRNPRIVASWDGAPGLYQPEMSGPGEFDFDLRWLIATMQQLPKELGLPLTNPAPIPDGLPEAKRWSAWLRTAGKARPPADAPDWVRHYRWDPKIEQLVLRRGYVWHCPVRVHPDDPVLTDKQWERIAQRLMEATGIHQAGCRWIAVRHADDHIHLMATLVTAKNGTLKRFYPRNDWPRLREACQQLEQEFGLVRTASMDRTAARQPTRGEVGKAARLGHREPTRVELRRLVGQAASGAADQEEFFARLHQLQVLYRPSRLASGTIRGCSFALATDTTSAGDAVWFGGGALAADLTWPMLQARWDSAPTITPVERTHDGRSTPAARLQVLDEAATVVNTAAERIRRGSVDPDAVAHATSEILASLALATEYRTPGPLTTTFDHYDRAARTPHQILPRQLETLGRDLRRASRRIAAVGSLSGRGNEKFALAALVLALTGLISEIRTWHAAGARHHQAAAAARALTELPVDEVNAAHVTVRRRPVQPRQTVGPAEPRTRPHTRGEAHTAPPRPPR